MLLPFPIPVIAYSIVAFSFLIFSKRAGGLKAVLAASYCGVIIITYTGGASGAIWLSPAFVFLVAIGVIRRHKESAFSADKIVFFANMLFIVFLYGIVIGLFRYDVSLTTVKTGTYRTILGLPLPFLMALYRLQTVAFIFLSLAIPLRYYIDRPLFLRCLMICWFFTMVLSVSELIGYFGIADTNFSLRALEGWGHIGTMGFNRSSTGIMILMGVFLTFGMTQLTASRLLRIIGYLSIILFMVAVLFSFSRAALLGLIVGIFSLALTLGGMRALKGIAVGAVCLLVVYVVMSQFSDIHERFLTLMGGASIEKASAGRTWEWKLLINWLATRPDVIFFGVGFQNFHYYINVQLQAVPLEAAHNNFLQMLSEFGIFGLLVFLGFLVAVFRWLFLWRRVMVDPKDRMMPGILFSLMLGILMTCLTQETLAPSFSMATLQLHFFLVLGIWISYYRSQMQEMTYFGEAVCEEYCGNLQPAVY